MKSIAGSIIVLSGALIMGLVSKDMPDKALPTLSSIVLMITGIIIVMVEKNGRE